MCTWENVREWNDYVTEQEPPVTSWDVDISLELQVEEIEAMPARALLAPIPENVPLPFECEPVPPEEDQLQDESIEPPLTLTPSAEAEESGEDWFEVVRDRRGLRGQPALPPRPPLPGRDPASLTTPRSLSVEDRIGNVGITQRGKKVRSGVDRWHYPNGTIRRRLREREGEVEQAGDADKQPGQVTFYDKKQWQGPESANDGCPGEVASANSTSLGPDETTTTSQSSDSSGPGPVGFWKAGTWIPRSRTPAELRAHKGGMGPQRMQRKAARVDAYYAGEWKPAWLRNYILAKQAREEEAGHEVDAGASPNVTVSSLATDVDPWSVQNTQEAGNWWSHGWYSSAETHTWTWTSTTSTSLPMPEFLPNHGLFPHAQPAAPPSGVTMTTGPSMELTNSERAHLEDAGVPRGEIQRLAHLFDSLNHHEDQGTGPESRWAVGRLSQRGDEGVQCLECVLNILQRRLRPRGHWPVTRVPRPQGTQHSLFTWAQQFGSILTNSLEHHLRAPLQPREEGGSHQTQESETSVQDINLAQNNEQDMDAASSSSSRPRSRSRSRIRDTMTPLTTAEAEALQVPVEELQGIWREPSTTSTSTGLVVTDLQWDTWSRTSTSTTTSLDNDTLGFWGETTIWVHGCPSSSSASTTFGVGKSCGVG